MVSLKSYEVVIHILNKFYSLQASASSSAQPTVEPAQLTLSEPIPEKVPSTYRQNIKSNGRKLVLQTSNFHCETGLSIFSNARDVKSICIPVDDWLRTQLTTIEKFILTKVCIPNDVPKPEGGVYLYKPLWLRDRMLITLSKWCRFFKFDASKGAYFPVEQFLPFNKGLANANIEVSHVFIGPHKGGHTFSLSLRVSQIIFKEEEVLFETISSSFLDDLTRKDSEEKGFEEKKKKKRTRKVLPCLAGAIPVNGKQ